MKDEKDLFEWLNKFLNESITVDEVPKNIFDISGYPHYENVISNIYAFFLREEEEHNFGRLFIDSLLELIPEEYFDNKDYSSSDFLGEYQVAREFYSNEGGRIDLVISSKPVDEIREVRENEPIIDTNQSLNKDWVIIIENKVNHTLNNDLEDYWNTFDTSMMKVGVVLSLDEYENINSHFKVINHKDLLENVLTNLKLSFLNSNEKYLIYLKDFIQNINSQRNEPKMNDMDKNFKLYRDNQKNVKELKELESKIYQYLNKKIIDFFGSTHFSDSSQGDSVRTGRHFTGKEDTPYEPFRFWINFSDIFSSNKIYVIFELHNKKYTKINFDFENFGIYNNYLLSKGGGLGKDYRHVCRKDITISPEKDFSEEISNLFKSEFFCGGVDKEGNLMLCNELQNIVNQFYKKINNV